MSRDYTQSVRRGFDAGHGIQTRLPLAGRLGSQHNTNNSAHTISAYGPQVLSFTACRQHGPPTMCRLHDHPTGTCSFDGFSPRCAPHIGRRDFELSSVGKSRRGFESGDYSRHSLQFKGQPDIQPVLSMPRSTGLNRRLLKKHLINRYPTSTRRWQTHLPPCFTLTQ
jgi:hypothetical protein